MAAQERTPLTDEDLLSAFKADVEDAVSFIDTDISPARAQATRFYNAEPFGDEEEGRSQIVRPIVRDTVRATLPSLMRVFFGGKRVVEFTGTNELSAELADEMTESVNYVFSTQNPGFSIAWDAFKDALARKVGWIQWWWDESVEVKGRVFRGCSEEQILQIEQELEKDETMEIVDGVEVGMTEGQPMVPPQVDQMSLQVIEGRPAVPPEPIIEYTVRIVSRKKRSQVRVAAVPPEEIIISRNATSPYDCPLVGRRCLKTRGYLKSLGIPDEILDSAGGSGYTALETNPERIARHPSNSVIGASATATEDQKEIYYVDAFYRVDFDNDGISELRRVVMVGEEIYSNEYADEVQLAALCPDPEPHTWLGLSQYDNVYDLQLIGSHVTRDLLDSLKASIFPRMAYVEGQANVDDVLNTEIGAAIRMRQQGAVQPMAVPFLGQQALPILDWLDSDREMRTGLSKNSMGLDPRALQSTTQVAAAASVTASQAQPELIARIFAETGMKRMFRGIMKLLVENQKGAMSVPIHGVFRQVDPKKWDPGAELSVDTALGVGSNDSKLAVLGAVSSAQTAALQQLGLDNPLVSLKELYHTQKTILQLSGFRDVHRFWRDPAESLKEMEQQEPEPTPEQVLADAQMKIEAGKLDLNRLEMILKDDRERDKNEADAFLRATELQLKYGTQLDISALQAIIERQRNTASIEKARIAAQSRPTPGA
jgi:hypothetical protein